MGFANITFQEKTPSQNDNRTKTFKLFSFDLWGGTLKKIRNCHLWVPGWDMAEGRPDAAQSPEPQPLQWAAAAAGVGAEGVSQRP